MTHMAPPASRHARIWGGSGGEGATADGNLVSANGAVLVAAQFQHGGIGPVAGRRSVRIPVPCRAVQLRALHAVLPDAYFYFYFYSLFLIWGGGPDPHCGAAI